jgi:hypothetical protein
MSMAAWCGTERGDGLPMERDRNLTIELGTKRQVVLRFRGGGYGCGFRAT